MPTDSPKTKVSDQIPLRIVTCSDQNILVVIDSDTHRHAEVRRNNLNPIVVCCGVIDINIFAVCYRNYHLNGLVDQNTRLLEDGHGLLAGNNVLNVDKITILTGNYRIRAGVICFKSLSYAPSRRVV